MTASTGDSTPDLAELAAPLDIESPDALHNPDVWELRKRVTVLIATVRARDAEIAQLRAQIERSARYRVPEADYDWLMEGDGDA